jgi:hypothetical protein
MGRRILVLVLGSLVLLVLLVVGAVTFRFGGTAETPCDGRGTSVLVEAGSHHLILCRDGEVEGRFPVALGRRGLGKQREGDGRTPTGSYPLGAPRPSARFHLFVPVGYPTPGQRARGLTGGDIGVHGPDVAFRRLGPLTTWVDWTQGCIAVGSRSEIERIAAWVEAARPRSIAIE